MVRIRAFPDSHPRNRLSEEADRRISIAMLRAEGARWEAPTDAESDLRARYEYAKSVLPVIQREYIQAGFGESEVQVAINEELDGLCHSFELNNGHRHSLAALLMAERMELHEPSRMQTGGAALVDIEPLTTNAQRCDTDTARRVEAFLQTAGAATGRRFNKKDFWGVAGYGNPREFNRWQSENPTTTEGLKRKFERLLKMSPDRFAQAVDQLTTK